MTDRRKVEPSYKLATVLAAHRRTLKFAAATIRRMDSRERNILRLAGASGTGLITLEELCDHLTAAANLKVRRGGRV